ncbi:MAG: tetratricopeptide repeat protein [Actinomycetaceae bacterium]|nr:tetratricopeptide repeat protein [Actinomycetaceae bacterium]
MQRREVLLRERIDELEKQGDYVGMVQPLTDLVDVLSRKCNGPGCAISTETADYAATLDRLGGLHRNLGNLDEAQDIYSEAVKVSAAVFGTNDPNYATTLNNYAGLQRLRKDYAASDDAYLRAEKIYNVTLGPDHVLTISCLNNRGLLRQDEGHFEDALELHQEALRRLRGRSGAEIAEATTLNNIATALYGQGKVEEALARMEEASKIYLENVGKASDLYLGQVNNLASMNLAIGNFAAAVKQLEWVVCRARESFGPGSQPARISAQNLAFAYQQLGRDADARKVCAEAEPR